MMEKKITSKSKVKEVKAKKDKVELVAEAPVGPPKVDLKTFTFPINSKFVSGNVLYTVTRIRKDSNTEWRTVLSAQHADQDYMLDTLRKDALSDPNFMVVDVGTPKV